MSKINLIAVIGPTASGKTDLAVALSERLNGEVISCDSMQIYRGMDISTAKPTAEETHGVPHHLIDIVEPSESFSAADYAPMARAAINDIISRGKLPIFCGGTGLYLDAVLTDNKYSPAPRDESLRSELLKEAEQQGGAALWARLAAVDPEAAASIHPNNVKRVARALEIYLSTGKTKTAWDNESRLVPSPYNTVRFMPDRPRDELYRRIDLRVDIMIERGLCGEVRQLVESGRLPRDSTAAQAIGYKELIDYIDGRSSLDDAIAQIKLATRRYAKRQLTWFNRYDDVVRLNCNENFEVIVNNAVKHLTYERFCDIIKK